MLLLQRERALLETQRVRLARALMMPAMLARSKLAAQMQQRHRATAAAPLVLTPTWAVACTSTTGLPIKHQHSARG
jgi:hypothetical protein